MRLRLDRLEVAAKHAVYQVPFERLTYFYGEMGTGKSTVARLVDYCFGGSLKMTPALQSEFVSAALELTVNEVPLRLERAAEANQVLAAWGAGAGAVQIIVPARVAENEVLPNTGVEVLSDLLFYLAKIDPPKVRRGRRDDSNLHRLSFRDLFWYCYLDQDSMDSSFFHLQHDADFARKLKSRTVLAYLLGYHQQRVAELEADLDETRSQRLAKQEAALTLEASLREANVDSEAEISDRLETLAAERHRLEGAIQALRTEVSFNKTHLTEQLTDRARQLASEVQAIRDAIREVESTAEQHRRHRSELFALSTKFQRVTAARAVLSGVDFDRCPRCTQRLPERDESVCRLCGQSEPSELKPVVTATEADLVGRRAELEEMIERQVEQLRLLRLRESRLVDQKQRVDATLTEELRRYDSAYLSLALETERRFSAVTEEARFLERLKALPGRVETLRREATLLQAHEIDLRRELREARQASERDLTNVRLLADLFLDCLVRSRLSGFTREDNVQLSSQNFLPAVVAPSSGETVVSSFDTLGSGGKKTFFKCCFAVAVHRLARRIGSILPTLLIIDSPMKNISERENREQFEGFYAMLYELAETELADVQIVMIDKEFCSPALDLVEGFRVRHMTVDNPADPPLIEYYRERPATGVSEEDAAPAVDDLDLES
jgi:hypothetical protein